MSVIAPVSTSHTPETLAAVIRSEPGLIVLRSTCFDLPQAHCSLVTARPFLTFRARGSSCQLLRPGRGDEVHFGNPWRLLDSLLSRYELLDEIDLPFPLGGAFGLWSYGLRRFVEPRLRCTAPGDLELPDAWIGFYDSLVVFDHRAAQTYVVATGIQPDGSRDQQAARLALAWWRERLETAPKLPRTAGSRVDGSSSHSGVPKVTSNFTRDRFCSAVERAQRYIRAGDIYQVNLSQRFCATGIDDPWRHWQELIGLSPGPFAAFLDPGDFQLGSVSPELFLRLSGNHIVTRPIKGTRPRGADALTDAQLTFELQTSAKEIAELVMITDLLRNDLGRVCEYGSVQVPDLMRLERFAQVQHLVSTIEGRLWPEITHLAALEACFPGGSVTGAPKIRAMEVIDELEPVARGPYTGCVGYLGFNRESQLSIVIRTSVIHGTRAWYHAGAGIVSDSNPAAEYDETVAKARGFLTVTAPDRQPFEWIDSFRSYP